MLDRRSPRSGHDPAPPWSPTPRAALCQPQQLASLRHLHATAQLCLPAPSQRSCSGSPASGHTDYDPAAGMPAPAFGAAAAAGPGSQRRCISVPAAVEVAGGGALTNLLIGPVLQCLEAATLGQPFEVWKTYMGRNRNVGTIEALGEVYKRGGVTAFWAGLTPKLVESGTKGAILMVAKENINGSLLAAGTNPGLAGMLAGAGGGLCQVSIMGPCTYLVTGAVTGDRNVTTMQRIQRTWTAHGFKGFYPGGTAIAFRQMTNWASRQGFTEFVRDRAKVTLHGDPKAKLTKGQEVGCGMIGGALACWNHPFEVARIEAQARADQGQSSLSMPRVMSMIVKEQGMSGLFKGIVPRVGLGIWQTLCMVTGAKLVKDALAER